MSEKSYQCSGCDTQFSAHVESVWDEADVACPQCKSYKIFELRGNDADHCGCCQANLPPGARGGCGK